METPIETKTEVVFNGPEMKMDSPEGRVALDVCKTLAKKRGNEVWMILQSKAESKLGQLMSKTGWRMNMGEALAGLSREEDGEVYAQVERIVYTKAGKKPRASWAVRMKQSVYEARSEAELKELERLMEEDFTQAFGA